VIHSLLARSPLPLRRFAEDSLFRNAVFLMASTGIMSVLGFLFWIFVARLYPAEDIGVASAVIAISLLVSNVSMLGLNVSLIRFLPTARSASGDINAALITVAALALTASTLYALVGTALSTALPFFTQNLGRVTIFGVLLAATATNSLTDSVFIAYRRAHYHTVAYTVFGTVRLVMAFSLVRYGALGIFLAYTAAGTLALLLSFWYMKRGCGYRFLTRPTFGTQWRTRRFALNNYAGLLLTGLPAQIVPSIIVARLGGHEAAYYTMAFNIANVLAIVPMAVEQSFLAEGSNPGGEETGGHPQHGHYRRAARLLFSIILPMVAFTLLTAPYLLRVFGREYAEGSAGLLAILAVSTIFLGVTALCTSMLNVQQRTGWIIPVQGGTTAVILGCVYLFLPLGLPGIGLAFLTGAGFGAIAHLLIQMSYLRGTFRERKGGSPAQQIRRSGSPMDSPREPVP
jgi:O-antigen/teichoic acid export membrane protein